MIKPWGSYNIISGGDNWLSKIIVVNQDHRLSLQSHEHRDEVWTIVQGTGLVTLNKQTITMTPQQNIRILRGEKHRIHNIGEDELIFIEVQYGKILTEDDIERFEDDYNR
jgi:mannose-6-phosphate isomerase-like protein (cupin superfamily)